MTPGRRPESGVGNDRDRCPDSRRVVVPLPHRFIKGQAPNLTGRRTTGARTIREGDETRCRWRRLRLTSLRTWRRLLQLRQPGDDEGAGSRQRRVGGAPGTVPAAAVVHPPPTSREYATRRRLLAAKHERRISPTTSSRRAVTVLTGPLDSSRSCQAAEAQAEAEEPGTIVGQTQMCGPSVDFDFGSV